ncbi:MAG: hypothetical protein Q4Q17_01215 [Tissierellia bacterium]|nr:hypothetical protein [Tissierellia bacterium]
MKTKKEIIVPHILTVVKGIIGIFKKRLGINSPSKALAYEVGRLMVEAMAERKRESEREKEHKEHTIKKGVRA